MPKRTSMSKAKAMVRGALQRTFVGEALRPRPGEKPMGPRPFVPPKAGRAKGRKRK